MCNLCYNISKSLWGDIGMKKSKYALVVFALLAVGLLSIYKINDTVKEAEQCAEVLEIVNIQDFMRIFFPVLSIKWTNTKGA